MFEGNICAHLGTAMASSTEDIDIPFDRFTLDNGLIVGDRKEIEQKIRDMNLGEVSIMDVDGNIID